MKTVIKSFFPGVLMMAVVLLTSGTAVSAQTQKLGYINSAEVIGMMPERDSASTALEAYQKEWSDQYQALNNEFTTKVQDYQKKLPTMSTAMSQQAEKDINSLRQRIEEFAQVAQEDMQKKEQELMQPIIAKIQTAITAVGKENNFTYIFDLAQGSIVYFNDATANNILPMVKLKLGLK